MRRRAAAVLLFAIAALGAGSARARLAELDRARRGAQELLYLPSGKYLKAVSLGHAPLMADFVYIWAIQYYSDYERADRYRYVEHVFGTVIPELDPAYTDPYWLGALILSTEAGDVDAALRVLDKGIALNPSAWVLPYVAGWECHRSGRFARAADYFDRAAKTPGAPSSIVRLEAGMTARAGNVREAIDRWREVLNDPRNDDGARAIASRQIRMLSVRADIQDIEAAIERYREHNGRPPRRLEDLVQTGLLKILPQDPDGNPYAYDPSAGTVSSGVRVLES